MRQSQFAGRHTYDTFHLAHIFALLVVLRFSVFFTFKTRDGARREHDGRSARRLQIIIGLPIGGYRIDLFCSHAFIQHGGTL
jgi:hypothetical protein